MGDWEAKSHPSQTPASTAQVTGSSPPRVEPVPQPERRDVNDCPGSRPAAAARREPEKISSSSPGRPWRQQADELAEVSEHLPGVFFGPGRRARRQRLEQVCGDGLRVAVLAV